MLPVHGGGLVTRPGGEISLCPGVRSKVGGTVGWRSGGGDLFLTFSYLSALVWPFFVFFVFSFFVVGVALFARRGGWGRGGGGGGGGEKSALFVGVLIQTFSMS